MSGNASAVAIGAMRLSTEADRDEARSIATLHAAFDAGATLVDTADAYARDDRDFGHNERLVARALETWTGDRTRVRVATKGGLTRPGGRWEPDGRAKHLRAVAEASRAALGGIDLYQLHAVDPRVPLATSVRALAALREDGVVREVGVCNVSLGQLREACELAPIRSVQVELSPWCDDAVRGGVLAFCVERGLTLLAYRPLGGRDGRRRLDDPVLKAVAQRRGVTPAEVVLAWLRTLSPVVVPLPGPTRPETAASAARAAALVLEPDDVEELDRRFPFSRLARVPQAARRPPSDADGDVVIVMGLPGAGKSTLAKELVAQGYARLNRDEAGGRLRDLLPDLSAALARGARRVVLDNTYGSRAARNAVIETAWAQGVPVRCMWLDTTVEQAQVNVAQRMLERYGRLLGPDEIRQAARKDPGLLSPNVVHRHRREQEPPELAEGFTRVDVVPFVRRAREGYDARALVLDFDNVVWRSRAGARAPTSPEELELRPGAVNALRRWRDDGFLIVGTTWQPGVAPETTAAMVARAQDELGVDIDAVCCPHPAGPAGCWCRRPLPGLGVLLIERHRLDPAQCRSAGDDAFTRALGFAPLAVEELLAIG